MSLVPDEILRLMRARLPLLMLAGAAAAGILAARFSEFSTVLAFGIGVTTLAASLVPWKSNRPCMAPAVLLIGAAALFFCLYRWAVPESPARGFTAALLDKPQVAVVSGFVASQPMEFGDGSRFRFTIEELQLSGRTVQIGFPLSVKLRDGVPTYGDRLRLRGQWRQVPAPRNPGSFDTRSWLAEHGIFSELEVAHRFDCEWHEGGKGNPLIAASLQARSWVGEQITRGIANDSEIAGILLAMTLGLHQETTPETQEMFRETGVWHLFSVSGLHVGMVLAAAWLFFQIVRIPTGAAVALTLLVLVGYCFLTGLKPACVRATVMAILVMSGLLMRRRPAVLNSLGAAALLILLFEPAQLFSAGFQLSFLVVGAIALIALPLQTLLRKRFEVDPMIPPALVTSRQRTRESAGFWLAGGIAVSVAAWLGSAPLIAIYFSGVSLAALPANLLCVPIAFSIVALAMVSLPLGLLAPVLGSAVNNTNWLLIKLLLVMLNGLSSIPGSWISLSTPLPESVDARITVFALGSGGCAAIECSRRKVLVDAGSDYDTRSTVLPYLTQRGINRLDALILTHGDAGHMGGARSLLEELAIDRIALPAVQDRSPTRAEIEAEATSRGLAPARLGHGDRLEGLEILYPSAGDRDRLADDRPLILLFEHPRANVLFLSDAGHDAKEWLSAKAPGLEVDVIVEGRHSEGLVRDTGFYRSVGAHTVILTDADFPEKEQVPARFVAALKRNGIDVRLLSHTGAVTMELGSAGITLDQMLR